MKKILLTMLISICLLGIVSAQISISPSTFSLSGFPGEIIQKNFTILTDGNYAVYLNSVIEENSSFVNITIYPVSYFVVEKNKTIQVNFTLGSDLNVTSYKIKLNANTEFAQVEVPQISQGGGSGGGGGGGIIYLQPKENQTKNNISEDNKSVFSIDDWKKWIERETDKNTLLSERIRKQKILVNILGITAIALFLFLLSYIYFYHFDRRLFHKKIQSKNL